MNQLVAFILLYKVQILIGFFLIVLFAYIITHWEKVRFWWLNLTYSFPVIGKISRLAKDISGFDENHKWFYSEERLCRDYYNFYQKYDKDEESYDEAKSYLYAAGELGRKPTPMLIWILILVLVAVEAFGFAYVLAGFTIPGASEATQQKGAIGIAILLAVLLVWLTHLTGEEIHKNSLIKKIRRWYRNDNSDGVNKIDLKPENKMITIDTTFDDKDSPDYIRMLNRLDVNDRIKTSYLKTFLTLFFVAAIAIGSTYIRGQVLEQELADAHDTAINIFNENASPFGGSEGAADADIKNIFGGDDSAKAADDLGELFGAGKGEKKPSPGTTNTKDDIDTQTNRRGGWATFGILGLLFVFIQILGVFFGMHWGFVGRESKEAYESLKGFHTKKAFVNYYKKMKDRIARIAQEKLQTLQHTMNIINDQEGTDAETSALLKNNKDRTFKKYLEFEDK